MFSLNDELSEFLLCYFDMKNEISSDSPYITKIINGDFVSILKESSKFFKILETPDNEIDNVLQIENLENFLEILSIGISSMLIFVQENWTGPAIDLNFINCTDEIKSTVKETLSVDGEDINDNIECLELLFVAKRIFKNLFQNFRSPVTENWYLRTIFIHQSIMDERCISLYNEFEEFLKIVASTNQKESKTCASTSIEISNLLLYYGKVTDAEIYMNKAKEILGIEIELVGELGRRTRFQERSIAQVRVNIKTSGETPRQETVEKEDNLPEIIKLEDDVRLDSIRWDNPDAKFSVSLSGTEQALLLLDIFYRQKAMPQDILNEEEILSILDYVLKQESCWTARLIALYKKCKIEANNKRTVERSLMQNESVIGNIRDGSAPLLQRLKCFWLLSPLPKWKIEAQLADIMLAIGLTKSALDIYLRLSRWEDVIACYTILQMRHKAAEIIRQELEKKPDVKLLCLLGDATDDVTYYEEAWNLSLKKSARPHRHWGLYLFSKKNYIECIAHFQQSLEINSLQAPVWLRLGYAALKTEKWDLAATAYRRYLAIEPNSFEAWNNLARIYIAQGDKKRAHKAFSEALKTNFENWQVWENFMITSTDVGQFDDVIRSYHRLLDLRGKHLDVEILSILVEVISKGVPNSDENSTARLKQKCLELLGRVTAIYPNEYKPWELYADLSTDDYLRTQRLQRAHRALVQDGNWAKSLDKCIEVIKNCIKLGESAIKTNDSTLKSAVRLSLRAAAKTAGRESWEQCTELLDKLEKIIEELSSTV